MKELLVGLLLVLFSLCIVLGAILTSIMESYK